MFVPSWFFFFSIFFHIEIVTKFSKKIIIKFTLEKHSYPHTHTHTHTKSQFFWVKKTTKLLPKKTNDRLLGTYQMELKKIIHLGNMAKNFK
jgi:hypothetical protein